MPKISGQIKREITVTAQEIYTALAKQYDFPSSDDVCVAFEECAGTEVTIIATERYERELP